MFFGKANDLNHYQAIANHVMRISPRHTATVETGASTNSAGEEKTHLEIRVWVDFEHVGHRFWVSSFEGPWFDTWIYRESVPKEDGKRIDVWKDTAMQIGELDFGEAFGDRRPFYRTNFAKTTAGFFFSPFGPLFRN